MASLVKMLSYTKRFHLSRGSTDQRLNGESQRGYMPVAPFAAEAAVT